MLIWTVRKAWGVVIMLARACLGGCWLVGWADLSAFRLAAKVTTEPDVLAEALPVIESAGPEVVVELLHDVAPALFLPRHVSSAVGGVDSCAVSEEVG